MTLQQPAANILSEQNANDTTFSRGQRVGLVLIGVAAYGLGAMASDALRIFADAGHGASLLNDPAGIAAVVKTAVVVTVIGIAGAIAGRSIRPDVGLFAAAIALLAIRRVGGPAREVYLAAPVAGTLWRLAVESALLAAVLGVIFVVTRGLVSAGWVADDEVADGIRVEPEPVGQKWLAFATQALVVYVLMSILCRSDERMQVTATLAIASIIAAVCTVRFIPAMPSVYFWLAPLALSAGGYAFAAMSKQPLLTIGEPSGAFASVLRSMPLDFASAGVAGSLYGYWVGRTMIPEELRLAMPPEDLDGARARSDAEIEKMAART